MFKVDYNPDVLSCLANLSSDEVFTPPNIANQVLDMLHNQLGLAAYAGQIVPPGAYEYPWQTSLDLKITQILPGFRAEDEFVIRQLKNLSRAAPIAIQMADQLITESLKTNLDAGLQLELDRLEKIFATADALEGLSALIESRRPKYQNR